MRFEFTRSSERNVANQIPIKLIFRGTEEGRSVPSLSVSRCHAETALALDARGIACPVSYDPGSTLDRVAAARDLILRTALRAALRAARSRASRQHVSDIFNRRIKMTYAKMRPRNPLSAGERAGIGHPKCRVSPPPTLPLTDDALTLSRSDFASMRAARAICAIDGRVLGFDPTSIDILGAGIPDRDGLSLIPVSVSATTRTRSSDETSRRRRNSRDRSVRSFHSRSREPRSRRGGAGRGGRIRLLLG